MSDLSDREFELEKHLSELQIQLGDYPSRAELAENQLARIYRSPAWKISKPLRLLNVIAWKLKPELLEPINPAFDLQRDGDTVFQLTSNDIRVEIDNCDLRLEKIALVASWSLTNILPNSVSRYIEELASCGYGVILISTSASLEPLSLTPEAKAHTTVIRRPNIGYDFGSWSTAFHLYPQLFEKDQVLVTNDSCYGPFQKIHTLLNDVSDSPFDVTALTDSIFMRYHLQSYFLHFKSKALKHPSTQRFWLKVYPQSKKANVVLAYEIGFTSIAQVNHLFCGSLYPWNAIVGYWRNTSVEGWHRLLDLGLPFIKREVVRGLDLKERNRLVDRLRSQFGAPDSICRDILNDSETR